MLKFKKLFTYIIICLMLLSSTVLATDEALPISDETPILISEEIPTNAPQSIYEDLYIYNTENYTLTDIVYGNVFASTTKFVTNPRNKGGVISGNLFVLSNEVVIGSDVSLSNNKDNSGNYIVSSINSKSVINGNVYVFSDSFKLEAGSEIRGDLYIASTNVDIEQDAVIEGNLFVTGTNIKINGQVAGSAYITAEYTDINYLSYIARDLYLNSTNAKLAGIVYRNAFITIDEKLETTPYFRVDQNLTVNYASDFNFSGEVKGNADINSKNLTFKNEENQKCIIRGNLNYATQNNTTIPDKVVLGEVSHSEFKKMSNGLSVTDLLFSFFVLLVYVFVTVLLSRVIAPKAIESLSALNVKNSIISLVIGFASLIAMVLVLIFLLLSGAGVVLALFAVIAYLFVLGLALPLLLYNIANMIKLNLHLYVKLLIVTAVFYVINLIPVVGTHFVFVALLIGLGRLLLRLFHK